MDNIESKQFLLQDLFSWEESEDQDGFYLETKIFV